MLFRNIRGPAAQLERQLMITPSSATLNFNRPPESRAPAASGNGNQRSEGLVHQFLSALIGKMTG